MAAGSALLRGYNQERAFYKKPKKDKRTKSKLSAEEVRKFKLFVEGL